VLQLIRIRMPESLKPYNTFGIDAQAAHLEAFASEAELADLLPRTVQPLMVLGGGSNVLFTRHWPGTVLHNRILGKEVLQQVGTEVHVRVGGGENWHDLVLWAVAQGFGGIENLSLIPGTVGAAPIQNIGAYGVELKDVFVQLEAMDLQNGTTRVFTRADCQFGYRDSVFKREAKGRYAITHVVFSLHLPPHQVHVSYGDIQRELHKNGVTEPGIADVSAAVIAIRSSKLPDPAVLGNCGSFFKNPEIEQADWARLAAQHPEAPHFAAPEGRVKVPAGWLIEQCGWKGKRVGNTGAYEKQALVLVNYGGATGEEVRALAEAIVASVWARFGVRLEAEVNMI
jgi:UDP-N-acetylmuramate dehydrogenase